jgi:hypothetical protein
LSKISLLINIILLLLLLLLLLPNLRNNLQCINKLMWMRMRRGGGEGLQEIPPQLSARRRQRQRRRLPPQPSCTCMHVMLITRLKNVGQPL